MCWVLNSNFQKTITKERTREVNLIVQKAALKIPYWKEKETGEIKHLHEQKKVNRPDDIQNWMISEQAEELDEHK